MKKTFLFLLAAALLVSCKDSDKKISEEITPTKDVVQTYPKMEQLSWVLGNWDNITPTTQSYERWEKENDSLYIAFSLTMKDGDTIFAERMKLFQNDGIVGLFVETVGPEPNPVVFTQVPNAEHVFTFENQENEFPSQIIYTLPEPNKLHAWVSGAMEGNPHKIDFYFHRSN